MRQLVAIPVVLLAAATLATVPAGAQQQQPSSPMRDYEYTFRVTGESDRPTTGTVRVSGDRGRIDIDDSKEKQFMLLTDGGRTLTVVHPDRREYEVSDAAAFEHVVGSALRTVGPIVSIRLDAAHVASDHLGDGGVVAGRRTQRVRLTQDYTLRVGALGFGGDPERHIVTTEYWVSPGLTLMRNPFFGLIEGAQEALAQSDTAYVRIAGAERDALLGGATPLRRVVTSRDEHGKTKTQTIEITALRATARPDPALFEVPGGYTRRDGMRWLTSH